MILDLGCGSGRDIKEFARRGFVTLGVDYSFELLRHARKYSGQRVVLADFVSMEFHDESFDAVWAVASLVHTSRNHVPLVLEKLYRWLRRPGVILTSMQSGEGHMKAEDGRQFELYRPGEWEDLLV